MTAFRMPFSRMRLVRAHVCDPAEADDAARLQPLIEMTTWRWFDGSVIGACTMTPDGGSSSEIGGLDVFLVGADIADVRKSEGNDVASVGRVGEDFLITSPGQVLKPTQPTGSAIVAPRPKPSSTVPSAKTRSAVVTGAVQPFSWS